jgi:hypothetical protein
VDDIKPLDTWLFATVTENCIPKRKKQLTALLILGHNNY